jgi:hypothetical protein
MITEFRGIAGNLVSFIAVRHWNGSMFASCSAATRHDAECSAAMTNFLFTQPCDVLPTCHTYVGLCNTVALHDTRVRACIL